MNELLNVPNAHVDFAGPEGFLGTRASLMLDLVFLAMFLVILVMAWSIYLVKYRQQYALHKKIQLGIAIVLAIAVTAFEVEMRIYGWQERAIGSLDGIVSSLVWTALYIHLFFAISSVIIWPVVIFRALKRFDSPPVPNEHSRAHRLGGRVAAFFMLMTSVTGWVFYWVAFVK